MRPRRIFLIRHGESEGNIDLNTYARKQDFKLLLTETGKQQAIDAGRYLKEKIGDESVFFYVSPLWRTRMTFEFVASAFDKSNVSWREDPRLREQEWGHFRDLKANATIDSEREKFGTFYYRIKDGESCADVYDRISDFMHSLFRDFEKPGCPDNIVIVTHGMTLRIFLMRWFHWTIEEFEALRNPKNAEIVEMVRVTEQNRYTLTTLLRRKKLNPADTYQWRLFTEKNIKA